MTTKKTTTQRGLGWAHQKQVKYLLRIHVDGSPCWWCTQPMWRDRNLNWDGRQLEGDHSLARAHHKGTKADRLLHGECNRQRSDGTRDAQRPAVTGLPVGEWPTGEDSDDRSQWCAMSFW